MLGESWGFCGSREGKCKSFKCLRSIFDEALVFLFTAWVKDVDGSYKNLPVMVNLETF